jgi:outer membrane protein OmpA-like peptidoglycan-associated protein
MRFLVIVVLFFLAVAGAALLAKVGLRGNVEEELRSQAVAALAEAGYTGVEVEFDHLNGKLTGYVDHPGEVAKVFALLGEKVPTAYWPEPATGGIEIRPTLAPKLRVVREEGGSKARIEGVLSDEDEAARALLGSRIHSLAGIAEVDNAVTLDPMYLPFPKMAEFASLVTALFGHPGAAEVELSEGVLTLSGTLPNDGLKAGIADLAAQLGASRIEDRVQVKMPDTFLRVSELRVTRNRFGITLSGVYPAAGDRTDLLAALREAAPGAAVVDRITEDPNCAAAAWQGGLPTILPVLLASLGGEMTAEFNANQIRVSGTAGNAASRQAVVDQLEPFRAARPPFELLLEIADATDASATGDLEFSAVYEGGLLVLTGRVPDPTVGGEIQKSVVARLPEVSVKNSLESGAGEAGWISRLPEFFAEALARVSQATFTLRDGVLDLEGRTIALPDRQIVQNIAVNTVPATVRVQNRLLHADQPFPKPSLLPEDRTRLAEALKPFAVYFDKASDIVKEKERSKIASIAEAIKAAGAGVDLVVTGFSDNVGNSASNEELSLRRAGNVRAELVRLGLAEDSLSLGAVEEDVSRRPRSEAWKSRRVEVSLKPANPTGSNP